MRDVLEPFRRWLARRRQRRSLERRARRLLDELFRSPDLLAGTSLGRRHAGRWVYLGHDVACADGRRDGGMGGEEGTRCDAEIVRVRFGILRHPRPYAFSRQSHKVIEHWTYDVREGRLDRERGLNLTRVEGRDAD